MKHAWIVLALVACGESRTTEFDLGAEVDVAPETRAPEVCDLACQEELRCPGGCAKWDGPCMEGYCGDLSCVRRPLSGQLCDDGRECTDNDRCALGMCVGNTARCTDGVECGEFYCPGADAVCNNGHCERCSMALENSDCAPPIYPRLVCPNMPTGERVVARLGQPIRDTGEVYYPGFWLSWTDSSWGDVSSGWCDPWANWPEGCYTVVGSREIGWSPRLSIQRLTFSDEAIGVYLSVRTLTPTPMPELREAICDNVQIGGAVLSIEVER